MSILDRLCVLKSNEFFKNRKSLFILFRAQNFKVATIWDKIASSLNNVCLGIFLVVSASVAQAATTTAPAAPTWGLDPVTGTLLTPGISVNTMGTLGVPRPGDGDHTLKIFDVRSATLSPARPVQSPDTHLHHNWDVGSIGNVYGLAIDNTRNIYTTASTHFGSYYGFEFGNNSNIGFGSIGAGAVPDTAVADTNPGTLNDLDAAGATYKIDSVTGNASLFATLPQTATTITHEGCEVVTLNAAGTSFGEAPTISRNTGPALGNVAYDKVRNQLYISNFGDGKIYLFDAGATVPVGGFDENDALSVFDPVGFEGLTSADRASPYGLAVSPDGKKLYYGTHEINKTPQLFAVDLDANGAFVGSEIDQNAQLVTDLQYTQDLGGLFSSDGGSDGTFGDVWVAYSDLNFSPDGELIIGLRTGCKGNIATSHNHGGAFYLLKQDAGGLYNTPADKVPGTGTTYTGNPDTTTPFTAPSAAEAATRAGGGRYDAGAIPIYSDKVGVGSVSSGPDDGYGGVAIYDKGDGTYDFLVTSSDMTVEQGPHGFMVFPHDFTLDTSATAGTNTVNPLASFPSLPSSTTATGQDYKGVGGDIEVLSVLVDWGDAPDTYSTDLITGNSTGGADVRGPTHILTADGIILGTTVDNEFNGVPTVGADGDDNAGVGDDEDGISAFPLLISTATVYSIPIANISAANSSGGAVTIHAWIDFDGNGSFDPDEYTTATVAAGATAPTTPLNWSGAGVSGLPEGITYARFRITNDTNINASTPGGPAANGEVEDYALQIVAQVSLGSTIWEDTDADGTQDTGEPAIAGATVTLLNANGTIYDSNPTLAGIQALTDTTDADGQYNFNALPEGDYRVQVDLSTVVGGDNYIVTPPQVADPDAAGPGQDNNTDSNVDTAFDPNTTDLIHTSGIVTLSVGGEPTGETDPIGAGGADQPNQGLTTETEPDNGGNMTVDMGFIKPVSLGSTVWLDSDEDGTQDATEPGIVGATVTLLNANGTVFDSNPNVSGIQALTDTTDAEGQYNFNNLPEGDYRVQVNLAGATNTNAVAFIPTPVQVADPDAAGPGQDNNTDSNIDGPFDPNTADQIHTSGVVTLTRGGEPTGEVDPIGTPGADQPNQTVTQRDSNGNMTVDFGFIEPVSIGSTVWLDTDADGIQEASEPAIVGVTVTLLNANGTVFDSDPITAGVQSLTDTTDAEGQYNFNGLPDGDYRVQVNLNTATSHSGSYLSATQNQVPDPDAAGPGQDNNTDSNIDSSAPGHNPAGNIYQSGTITLSIGGEPSGEVDPIGTPGTDQPNQGAAQPDSNGNMTVDFGFISPVSLGSTIWQDTDADGTQDAAEPAIAGATITLLNANGSVFDSNTDLAGVQALTDITDADGQYNFDGLPTGDYRVQVDLSTVTNGSDLLPSPVQVADPDAAGPGQDNNTDSNIDLVFDVNTADLIHTSGVVTLLAGSEPTGETDPIGAGGPDQPNQGLTATDDPDNAGNMTVDMGFVKPVSIGSTAWLDSDEDGVQDASESAVVGATVTLLNANGTVYDSNPYLAGVQALTDTTDSDGQYNFDDLVPGDYRVQIDLSTATNTNAGAFIPSPTQVADPDAAGPGQDNNTDSNIDEAFDPNTADQVHTSGVVTLTAGGEPTDETDPIGPGGPDQPNQGLAVTDDPDNSGNMTVDFGFIEPVSIGSTVWFDSDSDGVQDAAEPAIAGVTVTLLNANGTVFDNDPVAAGVQALTDVTDADGQYNFNGLPEGDYRVQVDLNTATSHTGGALDATPTQVSDPDAAGAGQDNNTDSNIDNAAPGHNPAGNIYQSGIVTLSVGGEPTGETDPIGAGGADQPNQTAAQPDNSGNMTVDFGFVAPVSLGSTIWNDTDADGTQDAAEPAIVGATITLLNSNGTVFDSNPNVAGVQALTDVTDADGQYNFDGLIPGDYRVQVNLGTVTGGDDYIATPVQVADPDAAGPGQDNNTDSNVDTAFDTNVNDLIHTSGVVTLTVGGEPTGETDPIGAGGADQPNQGLTAADDPDNSGNMTVDMGFIRPVSLGSTVWLDSDEDGIQDATEPGIVGATVTLLNSNGTVYDSNPNVAGIQALTDTTDGDGQYNFNDIPEGDYRVQVNLATATNTNAATFIPSPSQVADPDAAGPGQDNNTDSNIDEAFDPNTADQIHTSGVITLSVGGEPTGETDPIGAGGADQPSQGLSAANQPDANGNMTVDFGFIEPVSLGSTVWFDSDSDGVQDAAEPAIVGVTVTLLNANGSVFDNDPIATGIQSLTDVTDADGQYNFNGLPEGDYRVQVDLNTATSHTGGALDATPTQVADPDAAGAGQDNNTDSNIDNTAPGHNPAGNIYQSGVVTLSVGGEPTGETDPIGAGGADQPNQTAAQPDNSGNMTVDFGFIAPVSLGSTVWEDLDGDGTQDAAEPAIVGATITLLNADGSVFDSNPNVAGVQSLTDVTDSDGQYNFDGIAPGDYRVQVDLSTVTGGSDLFPSPVQVADPDAAGPGQDNNTDSNIDTVFDTNTADQIHTSGIVTLSPGSEPTGETDPIGAGGADQPNQGLIAIDDPDNAGNMTVDLGFVRPVSLGSTIWQDNNVNGTQDDTETPIVGATITLLNGAGTAVTGVAPVLTDATGQYNFNGLPPGDYRIQVDLSTVLGGQALIPSPVQVADPDGDDNTDSNVDVPFDTNAGDQIHTSGVVTLLAGGEPTGEVDLVDGVDGNAAVPDQPGQTATNPDNSGNMTVDFGFFAPVSIGSFVWEDLNGDGLQDAGEPPLAGAMVELLVETAPGVFGTPSIIGGGPVSIITVGPSGLYEFSNLLPGNYKVRVTPPAGVFPSPVQNVTPDDDTPNDSNIATELGGTVVESAVFTLTAGGEPNEVGPDSNRGDDQDGASGTAEDLSGNMTIDFGFVPSASLGNYVWLDLDMDGVQDANEEGIANVTVNLYEDTNGDGVINGAEATTPVSSATTGPNGEYLFPDLEPGVAYQTGVDVSTLPPGLVQTFDEGDGVGASDSLSDPIVLDPNEFHETADFGYAPQSGVGAVGDTIWVDADDDGVQDPGEPGIAGVTVSITPAPTVDLGAGPGVAITTVTDANGKYLFPDLPLDQTYIVEVDTTTLPPLYMSGPSNLGDPDVRDGNSTVADNQTTVVITTENPINLDLDFGYLPPADQNNTIGDTLWVDVDEDGNGPAGAGDGSDTSEQVLPGVTVTLIQDNGDGIFNPADDAIVATTITDANGMYLFTGIPDGDYIVLVTDQNNVLAGLEQTYDSDDAANPGMFMATTPNASFVDDLGVGNPMPEVNLDQDFGYVDASTSAGDGSIGDTIFFDEDNSGSPDAGEGLEGVTVELYGPGPDGIIGNGDDVLVAVETTDENGNYLFTGLDTSDTGPNPGTDYRVVVVPSSLPNGGAGWVNSVDPNTANPGDNESVTTLTAATPVDLTQDFGYISDDMNSLSGTIWPDTDGDGELAESGRFGGVTVELRDSDGNVIQTTTTDVNGDFMFANLPDGIYTVVVTDDDNVLNGFEHTDSPNGASDTGDSTSKDDTGYTVDLDSAGISSDPVSDSTSDFGYMPVITNPISLGSFNASSTGDGQVLIEWTTQTEVANLGFKLYGRVDDEWVLLNADLILGQGDSVSTQHYDTSVATEAVVFAIADIDLTGTETLHGPFQLGKPYGGVTKAKVIDWAAEKADRERKALKRAAKRVQQQKARMLKRAQKQVSK